MINRVGPWPAILADAHRYPSPYNSQPITIRIDGPESATLFYDKERGLPAKQYGVPLAFVCMGIFLGHLDVAAAGHGWTVHTDLMLTPLNFDDRVRHHQFARVRLSRHRVTELDRHRLGLLRSRQTSRRPYDDAPVGGHVIDEVRELVASYGHRFRMSSNPGIVNALSRINQETLFDDICRESTRQEMTEWMRFSKRSAAARGDGLTAETLLVPGPILRAAILHHRILENRLLGAAIRRLYLRTMVGARQLGWVEGPFTELGDYVSAGRCFIDLWLAFGAHHVRIHPYGTVIANPDSRRRFVDMIGAAEAGGERAWLLFRFGHSEAPPRSHRRPVRVMIIDEPGIGSPGGRDTPPDGRR